MEIIHEAGVFFVGEKPATKAERSLLSKIDTFILPFLCLAQFMNYLDRQSLANAYVSGIKEEIGFTGIQYNLTVAIFLGSYIQMLQGQSKIFADYCASCSWLHRGWRSPVLDCGIQQDSSLVLVPILLLLLGHVDTRSWL